MSGNSTGNITNGDFTIFSFNCSIPIPSYLIAIVSGNLQYKQIGARTGVITEPTSIDKCANELSELESFL